MNGEQDSIRIFKSLPGQNDGLPHGESTVFAAAFTMALAYARKSPCAKDQRGAAVWHPEGAVYAGHNGPPAPFKCDGSTECRAACGKLAVHAEERALLAYLRVGGQTPGAQALHIRVVDGQPVPSGPPSCTTCSRSRSLLEAGVSRIWLWHEAGWRGYAAAEFHELSLGHEKNRLPVIRGT